MIEVSTPEPHIGRTKDILKAHPELKALFGPNPWSALIILLIICAQFLIACALKDQSIWITFVVAFCIGAVLNHALLVLIHEAAHNLIFKSSHANKWWAIVANLPMVFPAAIGFRIFHLLHHRYQGELNWDADLSGIKEAEWVGRSPIRKGLWLLSFLIIEGVVRPRRLKGVDFTHNVAIWLNLFFCILFTAFIFANAGVSGVLYLTISSFFSVGLHPLGARWIQEHYVVKDNQETYSYYGALNFIMLNVGYHNEHHDLVRVPWNRLPKVKQMAPEFYENLYHHPSYLKLLFQFFTDQNLTLQSRVVRKSHDVTTQPVEF